MNGIEILEDTRKNMEEIYADYKSALEKLERIETLLKQSRVNTILENIQDKDNEISKFINGLINILKE